MNLTGILQALDQLPAFEQLLTGLDDGQPGPLHLPEGARSAVLAQLYRRQQRPILLITGRVERTSAWQRALESWLPDTAVLHRFYAPTPLPYERGPWSDNSRLQRLQVLCQLMAGQHPSIPVGEAPPLIITSVRALLQKTIPQRRFMTATRVLRLGQILDLEKTLTEWADVGYEAASVVEAPGQFSRRGGILDIFPPPSPYPVRIELFGDEIDTMRQFDPATQRTVEVNGRSQLERLIIPPAREALPGVAADFALSLGNEWLPEVGSLPSWQDDVADLRAGRPFSHLEYYLPLLYPRPASLLDYLPDNALVVVDDELAMREAAHELHRHARQIAGEQPSLPPSYPSPLWHWDEIGPALEWWQPLILGDGEETAESPSATLADAFEVGPRYGGQITPLMNQLRAAQRTSERIVIASSQAARLADLWRQEQRKTGGAVNGGASALLPTPLPHSSAGQPRESLPDLPPPGSITFVRGGLAEGFTLIERERNQILLNLLTDAEIFGWNRPAPRRTRKPPPSAPETYFADIEAGDHVVHIEYGIGRFEGLVVRNIGGTEREYLLVKYGSSDTLYVPVHQADRLAKWIGAEDRPPALHRLGEKSWSAAKTKASQAAEEMAGELLDLYATRATIDGHAFSADAEWQAELEASFPYEETEDQLRVINEVKSDMEQPQPMDRLICGDVGYGKTEVALRAAFKAVLDGKQVAILVPTTVLAQQHYRTFSQRLAPYPVNVGMLSRFRTTSQQRRLVQGLREGLVDIVIGTHRLLSDDVSFKDLGLVIIDEEQRFGVGHKERLKQWRTEVDVLTMTATPIPRTLYMSLTGVRDISTLATAPADRLPVQTYVGEADETRLKRAIMRELDRGGQIFVVHNRVQTIEVIRKQLERLVPEARLAVGHGQMSERELERTMLEFADGDIDILLSTTIIESGLDFPNANTLIVDKAEQFGLAQLYQLRGRVGRGVRRAYAYFFHSRWRSLTPDAQARLEALSHHTELGAGYQIAMRDMELRGAGDLLGGAQSGHVSAVGLDLYTRLLANAVKRRKAEQSGESIPFELPEATMIDLPLAAYVPTDYVPDAALRLRLYRRMALLGSLLEIDEMAEELADRFGPIPDPVHNLLYQLRIKVLAQKAQVTAVITDGGQIRIRLPLLETGLNRFHLQRYLGDDAVRVSRKAIWMKRELSTHEWQVALVQVLERLAAFDFSAIREP